MKTLKQTTLFISILLSLLAFSGLNAQEQTSPQARHKAKKGDHIFELVPGMVIHEGQKEFELGIDYEFFPKQDHSYSIGFSFDDEWLDEHEYYFGPHIAFYFKGHNKVFFSSGIDWSKHGERWKNRVGLGHEFIMQNHFVIVPSVMLDHTADYTKTVIAVGFGIEF